MFSLFPDFHAACPLLVRGLSAARPLPGSEIDDMDFSSKIPRLSSRDIEKSFNLFSEGKGR